MPGGVRLTSAMPAVAVDQDQLQVESLTGGLAQQLDGRERAASSAADDGDKWPAVALSGESVHR